MDTIYILLTTSRTNSDDSRTYECKEWTQRGTLLVQWARSYDMHTRRASRRVDFLSGKGATQTRTAANRRALVASTVVSFEAPNPSILPSFLPSFLHGGCLLDCQTEPSWPLRLPRHLRPMRRSNGPTSRNPMTITTTTTTAMMRRLCSLRRPHRR